MLSMDFAFPGLVQFACAVCGHPRGFHRDPEGGCSVFCACKRWTAPVGWDLLKGDSDANASRDPASSGSDIRPRRRR